MSFLKINRNALLSALSTIANVADRKSATEMAGNVLLEKKDGVLQMVATNGDIQMTTPVFGVQVENNEAITVNAHILLDILRVLPPDAFLEFALDNSQKDEGRIKITSGDNRYSLRTLPAQDFARLTLQDTKNVQFSLPKSTLKTLLLQTQYAMSSSDIRIIFNATLFKVENKHLSAVATDGHRLALARAELDSDKGDTYEILLPRKTVLELNRWLNAAAPKLESEESSESAKAEKNASPLVNVSFLGKQVLFEMGGVEMISNVLKEKYPDYKNIIPNPTKNRAVFSREALLSVLDRVAVVVNADRASRAIHLSLNNDGKVLLSTSNHKNEGAQEEMQAEFSGESPVALVYNLQYLSDMLRNMTGQNVVLRFEDENATALFGIEGNDAFQYVVMPMRL